jgi:hypothetical protein
MIHPGFLVNWGHPLNRGLVCWYLAVPGKFGGTNWRDLASGYRGPFTTFNSSKCVGTNRPGGRLEFNNSGETNGRIITDIPRAGTLTNLTVSGWVKSTSNVNFQLLLTRNSLAVGGIGFNIGKTSGQLEARLSTNGSAWAKVYRSGSTFSLGPWYHVLWTFAPNDLRLFQDGVEITSPVKETDAVCNTIYNANTDYTICNVSTGGYPWKGSFDSIRMWYRTLTASEVAEEYRLTKKLDTPLLAQMPLAVNLEAVGGFQSAWARSANQVVLPTGRG